MKYFLLLFSFSFQLSLSAQIISYQKLATFSLGALDTIILNSGIPPGIITPQYEVDYYKVLYLSPYIYPDSLVQASGAVAIPRVTGCALPLAGYGHGTQTKRSKVASLMDGGQWDINTVFASTGYVIAMPDFLGLGDADPIINIPPYTHAYSESNATINIMRAARIIADSTGILLNGQVFLYGYSQGGGSTVSTVKEIQQNYSSEFNITASAPMSGAYDLIDAQVNLIADDNVYPTPGYLPYIVFAYQSVYHNLYNNVSEFLKPPYDTVLPPLFFEGNTNIGTINSLCAPVPRDMIIDSVVNVFLTDSLHPMRIDLKDNDLIRGWYPQTPMKLLYCQGDDQVSYLNSENAFAEWTAAGAPALQKVDLGSFDHNGCAPFAFLSAKNYFDSLRQVCVTGIYQEEAIQRISLYPNPAENIAILTVTTKEELPVRVSLISIIGGELDVPFNGTVNGSQQIKINTSQLGSGMYFIRVSFRDSYVTKKLIVRQ